MSKQMISHFFIIQMFRLQHSPLSGDSVSTLMGTAISQTQFHMYDFHCTLLARPVGSSVLGEPFPDHTCIPCQTDIIATKTKVTFMEFAKQRNTFSLSCLERQLCLFIKNGRKKAKRKRRPKLLEEKAIFSASSSCSLLNFACELLNPMTSGYSRIH